MNIINLKGGVTGNPLTPPLRMILMSSSKGSIFYSMDVRLSCLHVSRWGQMSTMSLDQSLTSLQLGASTQDLLEHYQLKEFSPTELHVSAIYGTSLHDVGAEKYVGEGGGGRGA